MSINTGQPVLGGTPNYDLVGAKFYPWWHTVHLDYRDDATKLMKVKLCLAVFQQSRQN